MKTETKANIKVASDTIELCAQKLHFQSFKDPSMEKIDKERLQSLCQKLIDVAYALDDLLNHND